MSESFQNDLTHKQFVVLGLIAEFPSHAYSIDQRIEERGMRNWTDIGKSSIYRIIGELEQGQLVSFYEEEVDNRLRKVYSITERGLEVLKKKVFNTINEYIGKHDENFYVAFSMLPILTVDSQIQAILNAILKMENHKQELEDMLIENKDYPLNVIGLFKHPIMILETDVNFLKWVLEKLKSGERISGPKTYNK
jgi:DNA-binding PadR family transcriptional regulator